MAKNLIEFKLHAGKVPYFIEDHIGGLTTVTGRCYGVSRDDVQCYLPTEVVILTKEQFIAAVIAEPRYKRDPESPPIIPNLIEMTAEEKTTFVDNWLIERGF